MEAGVGRDVGEGRFVSVELFGSPQFSFPVEDVQWETDLLCPLKWGGFELP